MSRDNVLVVYGTRPEAIKLAPIIQALGDTDLQPIVAVTGQHREMLDQVNTLFGIVPDHDLDIIATRQTLDEITTRALTGLTRLVRETRPAAVVVQGDTTSCFAGALAAFYEHVPVVHVEAGLRTWDRANPFPEEMNRTLTGQLATLHLAVSSVSRDNLLREGIDAEAVVVTGNTVIDALLQTVQRRVPYGDVRIPALLGASRRTILVTAHRRESWGSGMARVAAALAELAVEDPGLGIILPAHLNPVVRETLLPPLGHLSNVLVVDPLPYGEFCRLMSDADLLLTDSGGVQEEGPSVGKRVLVMRETTERPEGLAAGATQLVGTDTAVIVKAVRESLRDDRASSFDPSRNPYGDGNAARRSVAAIAALLGKGRREPDFNPS